MLIIARTTARLRPCCWWLAGGKKRKAKETSATAAASQPAKDEASNKPQIQVTDVGADVDDDDGDDDLNSFRRKTVRVFIAVHAFCAKAYPEF